MLARNEGSRHPWLIAIVASAGGIPALVTLLKNLPTDFPAPIVLAQHLARNYPSHFCDILSLRLGRDTSWIDDGDMPRPGIVHVLRPGQAAALSPTGFVTSSHPPSAAGWLGVPDLLLESVARQYGAGAIGIVLSGMLGAGTKGLRAIRAGGGLAMAQSPKTAAFEDMPAAAIDFGKADMVMSPAGLARALCAVFSEYA